MNADIDNLVKQDLTEQLATQNSGPLEPIIEKADIEIPRPKKVNKLDSRALESVYEV